MSKTTHRVSAEDQRRAVELNTRGLKHYESWNLAEAADDFEAAARLVPNHADYYLNHARVLARSGDYDRASMSSFMDWMKSPLVTTLLSSSAALTAWRHSCVCIRCACCCSDSSNSGSVASTRPS